MNLADDEEEIKKIDDEINIEEQDNKELEEDSEVESDEDADIEEDFEEDKFLLDPAVLYKTELEKSTNGFKSFFMSFSFLKNASIFEKILILIFLLIPALLGGILGLVLIILVFLFWQIDNILKFLLKHFGKIESFFKNSISTLKKKISEDAGGFFKKIFFSTFLYSVIMLNGIFYVLIKGIMIPLQSLSGVNKVISNFIAKITRGISNILKGPTQLALTDIEKNNLVSGKGSFLGNSKSAGKTKKKVKGKNNSAKEGFLFGGKQNANLSNKKMNLKGDVNKDDDMASKIFGLDSKTIVSNGQVGNHNQADLKKIDELEDKMNQLGMNSSMLNMPSTLALSNRLKREAMLEEMRESILRNITNNFDKYIDKDGIISDFKPSFQEKIGKEYSELGHHERILEDINMEKKEKMGVIDSATNNLSSLGYNNPIALSSHYKELRDKGVEYPAKEILKEQNPNWNTLTKEEKFSAAMSLADTRAGQEDLRDLVNFHDHAKENKHSLSCEDHLEKKLENAKLDLKQERIEFQDRYGHNCQELIQQEMKNQGIPSDKVLTDREFKEVATNIVEKFPEQQQIDMFKDLREHSQSYKEARECEKELKYEKDLSIELSQEKEEKNNFVSQIVENIKKETEQVKKPNEMTNVEKVLERRGEKTQGGNELSL